MKKYIIPILLSIVVGFFTSKFMFDQYGDKQPLVPVFNTGENLYFIQQGVYSTIDSVKENLKSFNNYIYTIIDGKYYVFVGMTKNKENADKMQGYYNSLGYNTIVKEFKVSNSEFLSSLKTYDEALKVTADNETIKTLIGQVINKYKELVVDS